MKQVRSLMLIPMLLAFGAAGCGTEPSEGEPLDVEAAALEDEATFSSDSLTAACSVKPNAGWYRHPSSGYICYYAELYSLCGQTLYAYNRDLYTNQLATGWGSLFAYACQYPVNGRSYRGQWATGVSASDKFTHTYRSSNYYPTLPRVSDF